MNWGLLSQIAQVLGGVTVVVAVVFGIAQLRQFQQQRRDVAAVELMRSLQDSDFIRALRLVFSLSEGIPAADLCAQGPEYEDAAFLISARFETVGLVVFRGTIPFDLVEDLVGAAVVALWWRLRPWVETARVDQGHPQLWEWFQWLAERFDERGRAEQVPAHERNRNWKPKR